MKPGLELKLGQNLTITPQLQQAIKLLQMSTSELNSEIDSMLENNPLLETIDEQYSESEVYAERDYQHYGSTVNSNVHRIDGDINYENFISNQKTLKDYLEWQLNLTQITERDKTIAFLIIDAINEDGYLDLTIDDMHDILSKDLIDLDLDEVVAVQRLIQNFDPIGIACNNLEDCLLVQLEAIKEQNYYYPIIRDIIKNDLKLVAKKNIKKLMQKYDIDSEELGIVFNCINKLDPNPGRNIGDINCDYVIPDVLVYKNSLGWNVKLNEQHQTKIRINNTYSQTGNLNSTDTNYIKQKLTDAKWFIKSISNRNETLLNVAKGIVEEQIEFLEQGHQYMKPLVLQDIATKLNLHESTISRVTNQKYMSTPQGVFELKYFFSSHVSTINGFDFSSTAIKAIIKRVITEENVSNPLSDQAIAEILNIKGINIARRTVAKYREALHIPSSSERK